MFTTKKLIFIAALASSVFIVDAQNTDSPYSRYGYGVLKDKAIGASKGMGGISYGIRSQNVNPGNPASYSAVDSLTFIFDMGISYSQNKLSDSYGSATKDNGGLDYVAMLLPLSKRVGLSFGALPYSSVGYTYGSNDTENGVSYQKTYSGSGGLTQLYVGLAYATPVKGLSIGGNVSYLYGSVQHERLLSGFTTESYAYTRREYNKLKTSAAKFDIGLQYNVPLSKTKSLTLGATYTPAINPSSRVSGIDYLSSGDTLSYTPSTGAKTRLPHSFGFGFAMSSKKLTYGADVTYQRWNKLAYPTEAADGMTAEDRFNDRWRFNAGFEYVANPTERSFLKNVRFRGGLNYSNSYINARSSDGRIGGFKEYGATVGFGLPFRDYYTQRVSYININFEYTNVKPEIKGMVKEQYFGVSLGVNLNDLWFMKNKFK